MARKLLQFPHSHFSEKVRWALDWKRLPFEKVNLTRGPHARVTRKHGPATTVPVLIEEDGTAVQDSTAILDYLERAAPWHFLEPPDEAEKREARELEELFDDKLGFHIRRFVYAALLDRPDVLQHMWLQGKPTALRVAFPVMFRLMKPKLVEALQLGPGAAGESEQHVLEALDVIDERLKGGQPFLVARQFTRADLTAAALMSPLTWPPEHDFDWPPRELVPAPVQRFLDVVAERPAYEWSLRMYREQRRR